MNGELKQDMTGDWQSIHLARERWDDRRDPLRVELPKGLSFLSPGAMLFQSGAPANDEKALLLEPLLDKNARLLLINLTGRELRVNDWVAPRVTVLRDRDQFRFDHGPAWQMAVFSRPRIGPPMEGGDEARCAVCLKTLMADTRCYFCAGCGVPMHLEDKAQVEEPLLCALTVGACVSCEKTVCLEEGYSRGEPNIDHE